MYFDFSLKKTSTSWYFYKLFQCEFLRKWHLLILFKLTAPLLNFVIGNDTLSMVLILIENYIKFTLVFRQIITRNTLEQICKLIEQNMNPLIPIYKIMHLPFVMRCVIWYQSLFGVCIIVWTHTNASCFFFTFLLFLSACMS